MKWSKGLRATGIGPKWTLPVSLFLAVLNTGQLQAQNYPSDTTRLQFKANAKEWAAQIAAGRYFLRNRSLPLLANDQVDVVRCVIKPSLALDEQGNYTREAYDAKVWLRGAAPAPAQEFQIRIEGFRTREDLEVWVSGQFSSMPLEDGHDWSPEIKRMVRERYIALGMDSEMVALALGGLGYQVDLERLDDGRVRETWKLQVSGDTRKVFTERTASLQAFTTQSSTGTGQAHTTAISLAPGLGTAKTNASSGSSSVTTTSATVHETGFYLFSGLPPQFLYIIFTDGKVTARKTEFLK